MALPPCFRPHKAGWALSLLCTPKAAQDRIGDVIEDGKEGFTLKIAVRAVPEDGKANDSIVKLLGKSWDLPKSSFTLLQGGASRRKTFLIEGDATRIAQKIAAHFKKD